MPPGLGLRKLYRMISWTRGTIQLRSKNPSSLRLSEMISMADAVGAPREAFLRTLVEETVRLGSLPKPPRPQSSRPNLRLPSPSVGRPANPQ
jgi:hypothetical protein